jgi:hypothetical protein
MTPLKQSTSWVTSQTGTSIAHGIDPIGNHWFISRKG